MNYKNNCRFESVKSLLNRYGWTNKLLKTIQPATFVWIVRRKRYFYVRKQWSRHSELQSKPRFTDSHLIQTRHYYGQFASSLGKESPNIVSEFSPLNTDTFYGPLSVCFYGVWLYFLFKATKTLFTWSGGPRSSGVGFFCFVSPRAWKQKKPTPLDRGPPLHVNRP